MISNTSYSKHVVIDNGSATIKAGFAGDHNPRIVVPNCTARPPDQLRVLVADEIYAFADQSRLSFSSSFECGLLTNFGCQFEVWQRVLKEGLQVAASECLLLVTESALTPPSLSRSLNELIFEDFEFSAACRFPSSCMAKIAASEGNAKSAIDLLSENCVCNFTASRDRKSVETELPATVMVDCGHFYTDIIPFGGSQAFLNGSRRLGLGGKLLWK
mmetsp:Transcript_1109/g.2781  ORF Transcript_1109/g.2781 Transcript_1109/m.2781 type:complete len:216 (-) Transcript_1109:901-1548(-)|eukprot:CAMPEP_0197415254 /NCGR_PEP_ID=MMETSP1170-20131217/1817_1 /TAXON_ID=54406 /ORGANISM="Sarcinochrysis sp, Strain CCMP770" /LENGTH=215 /DNA_ID=CAMNT_0042942031 /DNA_START=190 /DNA_END=837 /DNA_ORIENTATION=+